MTFDVRLAGGGVVGVLRTGTQTLVSPLQEAASYVVNPVADVIDSISKVTGLQSENQALKSELAEAEAALIAVHDQLARLELFEQLYELETAGNELGRTVADVIGRPDAFDEALIIDKGSSDGIAIGQPVVDTNGYVVGTVKDVSSRSATIVPITASRQAVTVMVGDQIGTLSAQAGTILMRLEVFSARSPVLATARVLTAAKSANFPAGLLVGTVVLDAVPFADVLTTTVEPFMNADTLRVVVVLAWPPDPVTPRLDDTVAPVESTTTTLDSTTTTTEGDG